MGKQDQRNWDHLVPGMFLGVAKSHAFMYIFRESHIFEIAELFSPLATFAVSFMQNQPHKLASNITSVFRTPFFDFLLNNLHLRGVNKEMGKVTFTYLFFFFFLLYR